MKDKKFLLAVAVLGSPILARAYPTNPGKACAHVPPSVIAAINAVLSSLGLPTVC